jgi:hypothetical protein
MHYWTRAIVEDVQGGGASENAMNERVEPTINDRRKQWRWTVVPAGVLLLSIGLALSHFRSGIRVTVQNTGSKPMRSAVLHVTGRSYPVGDKHHADCDIWAIWQLTR